MAHLGRKSAERGAYHGRLTRHGPNADGAPPAIVELTEGVRERPAADRELIARARSGDADAFGRLVAARLPAMLRLARAILHNEADARDVVQDAFVSAWQNLPRLRDESRFDSWLQTVVANRS